MTYTYRHPRPSVTVDAVLISDDQQVLLIQRLKDPFAGQWAFPGGFVDEMEDPAAAVRRELEEETGLVGVDFEPFGFYGAPGRDPRGHTISLCFVAQVRAGDLRPVAADDAAAVKWFPLSDLPDLAFDHGEILRDVLS